MNTYKVYLGSYEQYCYTFKANNLKEVLTQITITWPTLYTGTWISVPSPSCPAPASRFYLNNNKYKPALIIEQRSSI